MRARVPSATCADLFCETPRYSRPSPLLDSLRFPSQVEPPLFFAGGAARPGGHPVAMHQPVVALYFTMSQSRQVRRSNHFVAAGYLAPFTDRGTREGVLHAYRRGGPKPPPAIKNEKVGLGKGP